MKDKEKQIEETAKLDIEESAGFYSAFINDMRISKNKPLGISKTIMSFYCPKNYILQAIGISEDSVVLTREEFDEFRKDQAEVKFLKKQIQEQVRKETAREILNKLYNYLPPREKTNVEINKSSFEDVKKVTLQMYKCLKDDVRELAEQYGVEVE